MWEELLSTLTPVQFKRGLWFKRDDLFAPLGIGGINGSKLRQCIWLIYQAHSRGCPGLVSGASVRSPQLMMSSVVADHYGMKSHHVIGATKPETMFKHISVEIAARYGADFSIISVGYNPALQRAVRNLLETEFKGWMHLEYGISLNHKTHPPEIIEQFHKIGARQVANLPPNTRTLIIPAGSCNSATSILYGIALHPPPNLRRVVLFEIGPRRLEWMEERLQILRSVSSVNIASPINDHQYQWTYVELHSKGIYKYEDEVVFVHDDIVFHPTYEAKVMKQLFKNFPQWVDEDTCVWIVGAQINRLHMIDQAERRIIHAIQ